MKMAMREGLSDISVDLQEGNKWSNIEGERAILLK